MNAIPLNRLIRAKIEEVTYTPQQLSNIASTLGTMKDMINNETDFRAPILGGSYVRGTMVKGVSDVDVYFEYTGNSTPQGALDRLKKCLISRYPTSEIKQDKPSILANFEKIPINITPYKHIYGGAMSIPNDTLLGWKPINLDKLKQEVENLKRRRHDYIGLIKILKLWCFNRSKPIKNFEIEQRVCSGNVFGFGEVDYSERMHHFFWNNGFTKDANAINSIRNSHFAEPDLKREWLKFIEGK